MLLFWAALPLSASTAANSPRVTSSNVAIHSANYSDTMQFRESLRQDVMNHPNEFITFETQTSADRFLEEHSEEARRETDRRVVLRGIVGYWQGKMLVVMPSLSDLRPL
jgi:ferredoxin-NADP reductase